MFFFFNNTFLQHTLNLIKWIPHTQYYIQYYTQKLNIQSQIHRSINWTLIHKTLHTHYHTELQPQPHIQSHTNTMYDTHTHTGKIGVRFNLYMREWKGKKRKEKKKLWEKEREGGRGTTT